MKELAKYLEENYDKIIKSAKGQKNHKGYDVTEIVHEIICQLYEMEELKVAKMLKENSLHLYISRCVKLSIISPSTPYQSKVLMNRDRFEIFEELFESTSITHSIEDELVIQEEQIELQKKYKKIKAQQYYEQSKEMRKANDFIKQLHWYDKTLFKFWLKGGNCYELSRKTGISKDTLYSQTRKVINAYNTYQEQKQLNKKK